MERPDVSQTVNGHDPWAPVSREKMKDKASEGKAEVKQTSMAPFQLVAQVDVGPMDEVATAVRDMHNAMLARDQTMMAAMQEQNDRMGAWMKQLETVMMAPRKVTMQRGKDGMAQSAVSEVVGVRDKKAAG